MAAFAAALIPLTSMAVKPLHEEALLNSAPMQPTKSLRLISPKAADMDTPGSFYEGFEGRVYGMGATYDEWLPDGWQDISKSGHVVPNYNVAHNLTWRVLDNENRTSAYMARNCYAYQGEAFAYIMADVAYPGHYDLDEQDEWLITSAFTPESQEWLYFMLFYTPSTTVYNRATDTFDGRTNYLQVYASSDDGANWTKLWDLVDDEIRPNWTDERLRQNLLDYISNEYVPIYVNLKDFVGKSTKLAFRFAGKGGHGMALDNIAVGIPTPKPSFRIPNGFFKQGFSANAEYPEGMQCSLIGPSGVESVWPNTSEDALNFAWTYPDASGTLVSADSRDLTSPAYPFGSVVSTPTMVASFESKKSDPCTVNFSKMQLGGIISGKDTRGDHNEFGAGIYDIADPQHQLRMSSEYIAMYSGTDLAWEKLLGKPNGGLDVLGVCNYFPAPDVTYGFDFVDVAALVTAPLCDTTRLVMTVCTLDSKGLPDRLVGQTSVAGPDVPVHSEEMVNIRFKFPVPVIVSPEEDILVSITNFSLNSDDNIIFPYIRTDSPIYGNSLIYAISYAEEIGTTDVFYNLNGFPVSSGHFAGLLINPGVAYSSMTSDDDNLIEAPYAGITKEFTVSSSFTPDRWALTDNGLLPATWASFKAFRDGDSADTYKVSITVDENDVN